MSIEFPQLPNPIESGFVDAPRRMNPPILTLSIEPQGRKANS